MGQLFPKSANTIAKVSIVVGLGSAVGLLVLAGILHRSPYYTRVGIPREQPVPFSHKHHVAGMGIDCRFCHTSVEESSFAGIPGADVCMKCHSEIFKDAPMLEPIRESHRTGKPIEWVRVHDLPDYVYFDHSIHISKGVSCASCHGQVDEMPLMWKENTLHMQWCLGCHKDPESNVGPKDMVFSMKKKKKDPHHHADGHASEAPHGPEAAQQHLNKMTNCSVCHR